MIKNYFKTAWRHLLNGKMYAVVNIVGLALGIAVVILIGGWSYDEISFDKNFANYNRIAQVEQNLINNDEIDTWTNTPFPLAEVLRKNYGSHFKYVVMAATIQNDHLLVYGDKKIKQQGGFFESDGPNMLSLDMLRGSRNVLQDPSSLLLSASAAKAIFGNADPINKLLKVDDMPAVKVAGIYADFPRNSTFADLRFMGSWNFFYNNTSWIKTIDDPWRPNFTKLFVQLNDHENFASATAAIRDAKLKNINTDLQKKKPALFLHPMSKWHLYAQFKNGVNTGGAIQYVWMFGIIGGFVLLLACINFMNLSTARSEKRAKEVGIRKTLGSLRKTLILQFYVESLLTVCCSYLLALVLVGLSLPSFNAVADKSVHIMWTDPLFWLTSIVFILFTSLAAGSYPALYLSSFKPVTILKGTFKAGRFAALPRKTLVVVQFTVSIALIIATVVIYQQIQYAKDRPVNYTREDLVNVPVSNATIHDHFEAVKAELMATGAIAAVAESTIPTTNVWNSTSGLRWQNKDPNFAVDFGAAYTSVDYGKTIGWQIKQGRDFSRDFLTDSFGLIINEAAARVMNLPHPVGQKIIWFDQPYTIVGVVGNMITGSPYEEPKPLIFNELTGQGDYVVLKLHHGTALAAAIGKIETIFKKYNPEQPFEYSFIDLDYAKKFSDEERIGHLAGFFASLAVIISCLGLFALASFVAEQRKKEIGVRKVLGASVFSLWNLLSREFVALVVIAFIIAAPVAYYSMQSWLQHYAYRTSISPFVLLATGIVALLITLATVSFQSIRAALINPIKSLRTE